MEERAKALVERGVDVLSFDTAHGHSRMVIKAVQRIRELYPEIGILAGNVVTPEGTEALIKAGADGIKVGVGAGSICTTRIVAGVGMPQLTAVLECSQAAAALGVGVIADGGIRYSGDIVKAMAAGARAVMLGNLLAALDESPGEIVIYEGRRFKEYRGMGSVAALRGYGRDRYATGQTSIEAQRGDIANRSSGKSVPEGIEGRIAYRGRLSDAIFQLVGGLRSGMGYVGAANLPELVEKSNFIRITNAGFIESHPHSVMLTKEAPNYQVNL